MIAFLNPPYSAYLLFNIIIIYRWSLFSRRKSKNTELIFWASLVWIFLNILLLQNLQTMFFGGMFKAFSGNEFIKFLSSLSVVRNPVNLYIFLRMFHYVVEKYRKNLPEVSFTDFAFYVLFFPTALGGPVEKFMDFHKQAMQEKKIQPLDIKTGLLRSGYGVLKVLGAAEICKFVFPVLVFPFKHQAPAVFFSVYGLAFFYYFYITGVVDMAIGIGRLFGYKIMENFNKPLLQPNVGAFFRNWNISVYILLRDYFFYSFFAKRANDLKICLGFSLTIFLSCLSFHGLTSNSFILGIYFSLGFCGWIGFQAIQRRYPWVHRLVPRPYSRYLSIFLMFNLVSFGILFFTPFPGFHGYNVIRKLFFSAVYF